MTNEIAPLRVADEPFLVATTIERCPKTMMIRELFKNAIEAASKATDGPKQVEIKSVEIQGVRKLAIWNSGPGMSSDQLYIACDIASSIGKEKDLDGNFGMGAKVASLPSNRYGMRYRSNRNGVVSEVILGERGGVYGRLRRRGADGDFEEVIDVTQACINDGIDLTRDWTEVVLFGNEPSQDTVRNPYNGDPVTTSQWLADYLYYRFYRLPEDISVRFLPSTHKLDGSRTFRTIPTRAYPMGRSESVVTDSEVIVHYFYDPPLTNTSHNKSLSGAITSDVSTCAVVHLDEMYDLKRSRQWQQDAPLFGITFGSKHISVHVELPDTAPVRPEAYRQFLRHRGGEQKQVEARDFAELVRENRPEWLIEIISSLAPSASSGTDDVRDELQKLLNNLRVRGVGQRPDDEGTHSIGTSDLNGRPISTEPSTEKNGSGAGGKRYPLDDLLAIPIGAQKASRSRNAEKAPQIIPLHDDAEIAEKSLKGKAARYYDSDSESILFVNMQYPSVGMMQQQLELEYAASPDPEVMRRMAKEQAERSVMLRVGRAVVFALAKKLNSEWTQDDMAKAHSPESLSLAADDFMDAMQNARRRMSQALRTARVEVDTFA